MFNQASHLPNGYSLFSGSFFNFFIWHFRHQKISMELNFPSQFFPYLTLKWKKKKCGLRKAQGQIFLNENLIWMYETQNNVAHIAEDKSFFVIEINVIIEKYLLILCWSMGRWNIFSFYKVVKIFYKSDVR